MHLYIRDFDDCVSQYPVAFFVALLQNFGYRVFAELFVLYLHNSIMNYRIERVAACAVGLDSQLSECLGKLLYYHLHTV